MAQSHRPVLTQQALSQSPQATVIWPADSESAESWLARQPLAELKARFEADGYLSLRSVLTEKEVAILSEIYDWMLSGRIDTSSHRHDMGNTQEVQNQEFKENVCQIMWPSLFVQGFDKCPAYARLQLLSQYLLGEDMTHDFNMMVAKPPQSLTPTPWHMDESYWPDLPDKRAATYWLAVDATNRDNGCMWFEPGSQKQPLRQHAPAAPGTHLLACEGSEELGVACELRPGDCTMHTGRTAHYSRGNSTDGWRRGFIINFRPAAMVLHERSIGYDHGRAGLGDLLGKTPVHAAA